MTRSLSPAVLFLVLALPAACGDGTTTTADTSADGAGDGDTPPVDNPMPFAAQDDYLGVWDGERYVPLFVKGVNLGVGIPGTQPGELAPTRDMYDRWLDRMDEVGINAIRIYTLHYPRFYDALEAHNSAPGARPIYLFQGIWLDEDNPGMDIYNLTERFETEIEEVVDAVHGNRTIGERFGKAFGAFTADVSPWVIGWVIGREIDRFEAMATDSFHPDITSFEGETLRIEGATALEAWSAARLDKTIVYERDKYGTQRPTSMSAWPTIDPLRHPTEGSPSFEDVVNVDFAKIVLTDAPAGMFAVYHAYPYYPDFINDDPGYRTFSDEEGTNNYVGYLTDLKRHYESMPLLIGEVGVPSSWGNAHFSPSGMHHGGHDEKLQGRHDVRLLRNIRDTRCAGGVVFAWFDEWWKRTWIVDQIAAPRASYPFWHNVTSPEVNFGLISFDLPEPAYDAWAPVAGSGVVAEVRTDYDAAFFHVRLVTTRALQDGEIVTVGFDTYKDDAGESVLPGGIASPRRVEFALVVTAPNQARLHVTRAYNLAGIWHWTSADDQLYHSVPSDGGPWDLVRWQNLGAYQSDDGRYVFGDKYFEIGILRARRDADEASNLDAVVLGAASIDIRIPWTLLQVTDPTQRKVMDDDRGTPSRETVVTDGIALVVVFGGATIVTPRLAWDTWTGVPEHTEREKPSMEILKEGLATIADHPSI